MGEVIQFRPKGTPAGVYDAIDEQMQLGEGPLTRDELISVEDLLREGRAAKLAGRRRRELPTVFATGSDEPMLPCPLTDVSWMGELWTCNRSTPR